jgi:hypothetical protein
MTGTINPRYEFLPAKPGELRYGVEYEAKKCTSDNMMTLPYIPKGWDARWEYFGNERGWEYKTCVAPLEYHQKIMQEEASKLCWEYVPSEKQDGGIHVNIEKTGDSLKGYDTVLTFLENPLYCRFLKKLSERTDWDFNGRPLGLSINGWKDAGEFKSKFSKGFPYMKIEGKFSNLSKAPYEQNSYSRYSSILIYSSSGLNRFEGRLFKAHAYLYPVAVEFFDACFMLAKDNNLKPYRLSTFMEYINPNDNPRYQFLHEHIISKYSKDEVYLEALKAGDESDPDW